MNINNLKPQNLWDHFLALTKIPRPSGSEAKVRAHLIAIAKKNGFSYKEDKTGSLVIEVPATKGYEKKGVTVLQAHMDMVAEKNSDSKVDPAREPLDVFQDGDYLKARGTTLGADNGIGIAAAIAVAEDKDAKHGPLELLFTVEEETALVGAFNLDKTMLKGRRLMNLDSEEFGVFFVGCAGGEDTTVTFPVEKSEPPKKMSAYELKVSGLKGGHSGLDIIHNRANAIRLLALTLKEIGKKSEHRISYIKGGNKKNAIPREAAANIMMDASNINKAKDTLNDCLRLFKKDFAGIEDGINISLAATKDSPKGIFSEKSTKGVIDLIISIPSGVVAMSRDIPGMVETSTNLGVIDTTDDGVGIVNCKRTSVPEAMVSLRNTIHAVSSLAGARTEEAQGYPGWKPDMTSELLKTAKACYEELYKKGAGVTAIHAGLECGIIGEKFDGMDMISFGPTMSGVHSPDEKINISSTEKFYEFLKYFLSKLS